LLAYLLFYTQVSSAYHILYPMPVLYMASLCLIFGNFLYSYTHLVGCMKRQHYGLVKSTLLIPIYWAMASLAAYVALYQLIIKPHYWEKTLHGLHLFKQTAQITSQELFAVTGAITKKLKAITREVVAIQPEKTQRLGSIKDESITSEENATSAEGIEDLPTSS